MKNQLFTILTAFILLSCSPNKVEQDNNILNFSNSNEQDTFPVLPKDISYKIQNGDTIFPDILRKVHLDSLKEDIHKYLYLKKDYLSYKHAKSRHPELLKDIDTAYHQTKHINGFSSTIGEIKFDTNINGFLILFTDNSSNEIACKTMMLFVTKNNKLTSMVKLSDWVTLSDGEIRCKERTFRTGLNEFVFTELSDNITSDDLNKRKVNGKYVRYSTFSIDNKGNIKQINIDNSKVSKLSDNVLNWKYINSTLYSM